MNKTITRFIIPLTLIIIAIFPLIAFFHSGLPHGHDAQDHVVRIANFYQSLSEGIAFPRWGANLNWGYGHPVMMFLYPFSSYLASLFHFIGFSLVDATKGVFVISYIASILSMYLWMRTAWGKRAGIIGALLYGFAPYRFVDIYVRMAIGEHMAFVFPPLACFFLYKLAKYSTNRNHLMASIMYGMGFSVSLALLILSHNAVSLMFLPIIGVYCIYLFLYEADKSLSLVLSILIFTTFSFGLSSFFWIPAFFEGKYTLRNIITAGEALNRFVPFRWFFYSPWNYGGGETITKEIGIAQWIGIIASIAVFFHIKKKSEKAQILGLWILFALSLFIMTSASWWIWKQSMILQNFQFPLRFLSVSVFVTSCIGGISVARLLIPMKNQRLKNVLFIMFCMLPILSTIYMWHPKGYQMENESFYTRIYPGTTDTGESSPIWTTRFMEQTPKAEIEVISGEATVQQLKRATTVHEYHVTAITRSELLENTVYFPGWEILVDGNKTDIEFQSEIHRGIMSFWVEKGDHQVIVVFRDTRLRKISNIITIISTSVLTLSSVFLFFLWKRKK